MSKNLEKFAESGLLCQNLTAREAGTVVDQVISTCLRCPALGECDPKTNVTVSRLLQVEEQEKNFPGLVKTFVMVTGRKTRDETVCGLIDLSVNVSSAINLNEVVIPDPISSGR